MALSWNELVGFWLLPLPNKINSISFTYFLFTSKKSSIHFESILHSDILSSFQILDIYNTPHGVIYAV